MAPVLGSFRHEKHEKSQIYAGLENYLLKKILGENLRYYDDQLCAKVRKNHIYAFLKKVALILDYIIVYSNCQCMSETNVAE